MLMIKLIVVYLAGDGDSGDHWTIICDGNIWEQDDEVMLRHIDTSV